MARAVATSDDLMLFFTRPWSLFFIVISLFSAVFPRYQQARGRKVWTLFFTPFLCLAVATPLIMMGGWVRPLIAAILVGVAGVMLWRRWRNGWQLQAPLDHMLRE